MVNDVRAMVQTAPNKLELQSFPLPQTGSEEGLLRIEACGICGTDVETLAGDGPVLTLPLIPGHEPVGIIEEIGGRAAKRWGLEIGDRVVLQSDFGCGRCSGCLDNQFCKIAPGNYGFMPTSLEPALWGGYAEMMYLAPGAIPHKISSDIDPRVAALYNPLGAGFAWAVAAPQLSYGDSIAILGPGQRGLACVIAAKAAGAGQIIITGIGSRDGAKMALAKEFGADVVIDVESEDAIERIAAETNGRGVDVVVDTTPHATQPVIDSIHMACLGGTIILAGLKGRDGIIPGFPSDEIIMRYQTVKGVRSVDYNSFQLAVKLIESGAIPVEKMHTHHFPMESAVEAVRSLVDSPSTPAISITIEP